MGRAPKPKRKARKPSAAATSRSQIQRAYRARKERAGARQVVLFLDAALAENLKDEAQQQGISRSELVAARLTAASNAPVTNDPRTGEGGWPSWIPPELAERLEEQAKKIGISAAQLAAERLEIASRPKPKPRKIAPEGKGEASTAVQLLVAEGKRLERLGRQLLSEDSRELTDATFAGRVFLALAQHVRCGLPLLAQKGRRRRARCLLQAWYRIDETYPRRPQTFVVVAKDEADARQQLGGISKSEFDAAWLRADFRVLGEDLGTTSGVRVCTGRYPALSLAWWPILPAQAGRVHARRN